MVSSYEDLSWSNKQYKPYKHSKIQTYYDVKYILKWLSAMVTFKLNWK